MNELELGVAFIINELLEYASLFGAYDKNNDVIDYRRVAYIYIATILILLLGTLIAATCVTALIHFI